MSSEYTRTLHNSSVNLNLLKNKGVLYIYNFLNTTQLFIILHNSVVDWAQSSSSSAPKWCLQGLWSLGGPPGQKCPKWLIHMAVSWERSLRPLTQHQGSPPPDLSTRRGFRTAWQLGSEREHSKRAEAADSTRPSLSNHTTLLPLHSVGIKASHRSTPKSYSTSEWKDWQKT